MGKGNHVFNNLLKTFYNGNRIYFDAMGLHVDLRSALRASSSVDAVRLLALFPRAFPIIKSIHRAPQFDVITSLQDTRVVIPGDPNAREYGKHSNRYYEEMHQLGRSKKGKPEACIEQLFRAAYDPIAANAYINQDTDPEGRREREMEITCIATWVKGSLYNQWLTFFFIMRLDAAGKK